MKIPMPEPEFDEFADEIVRPIISHRDGLEVTLENFDEWASYTKDLERKRDAARLERGEISQVELRQKNGMLKRSSLTKARIVG